MYSEFKLEGGYTRNDIIKKLGNPEKSIVEEKSVSKEILALIKETSTTQSKPNIYITDTYAVEGRVFDCGDYWASGAGWGMTLGLHELFMFPASVYEVISENISPSKKHLEISYINNMYQCQSVIDN